MTAQLLSHCLKSSATLKCAPSLHPSSLMAALCQTPVSVCVPLQTQEIPSLLVPCAMIAAGGLQSFLDHPTSPRTLLAAALLVHYSQRALIYPLLIRAGKPTPLVVWAMALVFCCWNGYLQVRRRAGCVGWETERGKGATSRGDMQEVGRDKPGRPRAATMPAASQCAGLRCALHIACMYHHHGL
jgi:hypothetical protein